MAFSGGLFPGCHGRRWACLCRRPGDFLATVHVDALGVVYYGNDQSQPLSLCVTDQSQPVFPVGLRPLPSDFQPANETLPCSGPEEEQEQPHWTRRRKRTCHLTSWGRACDAQSAAGVKMEDAAAIGRDQGLNTPTHTHTHHLLTTPTHVPLLNIDFIKTENQKRNKPTAPPVAPPTAPFFLPTIPGLTPQFSVPTATGDDAQSKVVTWGALGQRSEFSRALDDAMTTERL
ncbi:hypothetical protein WMY93_032368 [Mugilogobius chulae]|uniref:WDR36/Utp21 C-terminal domain-containing protein n=1 Tax=Mugilogobius chulae TaxID=88201 RepID=A0AAW0MLG1_9GOBI